MTFNSKTYIYTLIEGCCITDKPPITKEQLESVKNVYRDINEEISKSNDFIRGLAIGIIYGIIGNIFVQFFYPVIEGLVLAKYDSMFAIDAIVSAISLLIILYTTNQFREQLTRNEKRLKKAIWTIDVLTGKIPPYQPKVKEKTDRK